jgi:glycine oxidase
VNVTVVGAGIVGCAVAYELASRGARVTILDPRGAGQGATRASAGVLAPYIEGHAEPLLRLTTCSLAQYQQFIDRLRSDTHRDIEFRRTGTLQVALATHEAEQLADAARGLAAANVDHRLLNQDDIRRLEPALTPAATAALLIPQHAYVGVGTMMAALEDALAGHSVTVETASLQRIRETDSGVQIATRADTRDADAVVLAAGSWSGGVEMSPAIAPPVTPVRGQLVHLRFAESPVAHVIWGPRGYLVPWRDGSLLVGATSEDVGFDESATAGGVQSLLESARELVPASHSARFDEVRVGLRPATADELPVIGASSRMRGVYFATGHYRNGVLLAPLTASMVADLVMDGRARPELALVRPDRFGL